MKLFLGFIGSIFVLVITVIVGLVITVQYPSNFTDCMEGGEIITQMEAGAGYYLEDWCYEDGFHKTDELNEIDGVLYENKSGEPFTGGFRVYEQDNKPLNLKDGFWFYHAYMNYENGLLNGDSVYLATCREDNNYAEDVLIETYKDGVLQDFKNLDHKCYDLAYWKGE